MRKRVIILGSTGSIGRNALEVARKLADRVEIVGLAAGSQSELLRKQCLEFNPRAFALWNTPARPEWFNEFSHSKGFWGPGSLNALVEELEADLLLVAIVGTAGLEPTLKAIDKGIDIALASKEILVMAGCVVMKRLREKGVQIIPVDSEHSAVFQCIRGEDRRSVKRIILTASGGPFRGYSVERLKKVTVEEALNHPTWKMGKKITIDSASLFNKGLEMIEAHHLFSIPYSQIEVVIHPQSIVHSLVEFCDGSQLAQLSHSDMCLPIQFSFTFPERLPSPVRPLNLYEIGDLTFEAPDHKSFPALNLARFAGEAAGTYPCALNAANEVAVESFLEGKISFSEIWECVGAVLDNHKQTPDPQLEEIIEADRLSRVAAREWIKKRVRL
ncbi:1-deoxy-D-xylulose-5-phosphate reductoisomerase [Candidatus Methylacidiphilum infernorum]|uniref:1-deoxy-D-xylulose 5-phosphate reductoisomerase n=1 Tax=Candidatus Methylacidiphilum infernorum TaxID=511746 RepID=A0ABX7PX02_9BACT|nr:1-deoxy-D-xylulose-5-phosphate reductoisomerase [Candidatus Methylacidiphilum infernorum]QSR87432.1 1-deoxy-D-xylulose-5-phosphate reductoisomerase [Candidatus Methylacidiphilum infernorum]